MGGVSRARSVAKTLNVDLAIIDKRRPKPNISEVMNIIGNVRNKVCIIMDDIVDTANTLCKSAYSLKTKGAKKVYAYCTHAVLSGDSLKMINKSNIDELVVTDSIPLKLEYLKKNIRQLSCSELLSETLLRISNSKSVSSLFIE